MTEIIIETEIVMNTGIETIEMIAIAEKMTGGKTGHPIMKEMTETTTDNKTKAASKVLRRLFVL